MSRSVCSGSGSASTIETALPRSRYARTVPSTPMMALLPTMRPGVVVKPIASHPEHVLHATRALRLSREFISYSQYCSSTPLPRCALHG